MKIIKDLVIDGELNPELKDLKCYVIINKSIDGMGLPGYNSFKVLIYDKSIAGGCLAHPITSNGINENFTLYFDKSNTDYNPLVITDNPLEADQLAELFDQFGYCSCKDRLDNVYDKIMSLTRLYNSMKSLIDKNQEQFSRTRVDEDDRAHRKFIEFAKDHYPKFLSNLNPNHWTKNSHGSCVYLLGINSNGTAVYHYPDMYGCWDVEVAIQLDDQKIVGINNGSPALDCEWHSITESEFLSSFNTEDLDNITGTKLNFLTNGKYK